MHQHLPNQACPILTQANSYFYCSNTHLKQTRKKNKNFISKIISRHDRFAYNNMNKFIILKFFRIGLTSGTTKLKVSIGVESLFPPV